MTTVMNYPLLVFALTLVALWLSEIAGSYVFRWRGDSNDGGGSTSASSSPPR